MANELDQPETAAEFVHGILENFDCQPILFIGAGLARRYLGAPDWEGALKNALSVLGADAPSYAYLNQRYEGDKIAIGTHIGDLIFEWAWSSGKNHFDEKLFASKDRYIFIKEVIASGLRDITPSDLTAVDVNLKPEIVAMTAIRPHAIITTNFDSLLERVFEGYEPIVGKGVLHYDLNSFGEIFHIHGSVDNPASMVVTTPDYKNWHKESQYFAAKLLTYFIEHPVFVFGYSLGDPNVQTVLRDIGRITADEGGLIENVVQVVWSSEQKSSVALSEYAISEDGRQFRLRVLTVNSLTDVFLALSAKHELRQVNPTMLRALAARVMKLTRKDMPSGEIEIDYSTLERITSNESELPKMLGLTFADNENKTHPFTLTLVAEQMGLKGWQQVDKLLKRIKLTKGVDLRATDNRYHCKIKTGKKDSSATHKWSYDAVDLFKAVASGKEYTLAD